MKKLIEVHSDKPELQFCSCCDSTPEFECTIWYKEPDESGKYFKFNTYLKCCKDKIGEVVDWYNNEDYEKVIGVKKIESRKFNLIAGYTQND